MSISGYSGVKKFQLLWYISRNLVSLLLRNHLLKISYIYSRYVTINSKLVYLLIKHDNISEYKCTCKLDNLFSKNNEKFACVEFTESWSLPCSNQMSSYIKQTVS